MSDVFEYHHGRAYKARLGIRLTSWISTTLFLFGVVCALGGVALLLNGFSIGWFIISLVVVPVMILEWRRGELKHLKPIKHNDTIAGRLDGAVLGYMGNHATPKQIASAVSRVFSGQFFAARFGITAGLLQNITSENAEDVAGIWELAKRYAEHFDSHEVTAGMVVVALIQAYPDHEQLLAQLHIDLEDLIEGIAWQNHLERLIDAHSKPRRTGGIARDFSFGYTPLMQRFGHNISEQIARGGNMATDLEAHNEAIERLIDIFGTGGRQNAAIIGPTGAGKTTVVHAFAEQLLDATKKLPNSLKFRQVVILDAASLLAAAPGKGELENLIMQVLGEAYAAKNVIICLDNAQLFFEEGIGSVDLSNVLLPLLEAGNLRMILTMDEQRLLQIGQRNPALLNALNRIVIKPASEEETMRVMQDQIIMIEFRQKVTFTYQALREAYTLGQRYVHDAAMPGKALTVLEAAAGHAENRLVTMNSVQRAIEKTLGIKVGVASGEQEKDTLLNLESLIHTRMINQVRAVQVVSDALRRARAGVRNPNRPIGTFLFLGPTGVGKTELAKALADVYFGGEEQIVRLDLNEYVRNEDVARLIADGADDPSSLTAQVMKQPFSVVLLDEIEKAHPNVLTTLLQLLDEGILRDIKNREVSFRDAIIIATSNAGADRIREYIERGYQVQQFEQQFIDELINSNQFRPEFLNRFDEIVTFTPLGKTELLQVIDLILAGVNKNLATQKIAVHVDDDAKLLLVDRGYDPRLGARPMRRVVQRAVENTVAKQMLSGEASAGATIVITREQVESILGSEVSANAFSVDQ